MIEWMRDPIKPKGENQRRRYTYVKSRESATDVINMGTRVDILRRENKTSPVSTAKVMNTPLNNVTARRSEGKNARTVTRRATKKRCAGRNKNKMNKNKSKRPISLKGYIITVSYFSMTHLCAKIKPSTRKLRKNCCWLRIYVTYGEQPENYDKPTIIKNSGQDKKQENNGGIPSRQMEGVPEKRW